MFFICRNETTTNVIVFFIGIVIDFLSCVVKCVSGSFLLEELSSYNLSHVFLLNRTAGDRQSAIKHMHDIVFDYGDWHLINKLQLRQVDRVTCKGPEVLFSVIVVSVDGLQ